MQAGMSNVRALPAPKQVSDSMVEYTRDAVATQFINSTTVDNMEMRDAKET
jgi:hypothetical protein